MRRTIIPLLIILCLSATSAQSEMAQQPAKASPPEADSSVKEALGVLVSQLKGARAIPVTRTGSSTERLNSVRAEGCVLRYNITSEWQSNVPSYANPPQVSEERFFRTDYEWRVNLADLDPARVRVVNPLRIRKGGSVYFSTSGGKEVISRRWPVHLRWGTRMMTDRLPGGYLPLSDEGSLEEAAAALTRAIGVCRTPSR